LTDNEARWAKQQELDNLDYERGYRAFFDNDPDQRSDSPAWRQGWEEAKAELEGKQ
jgi:hypothetical protein